MSPTDGCSQRPRLVVLPAYTGARSIQEALGDPASLRLLWLELLVNGLLDMTSVLGHTSGRQAYYKACRWYTESRSLVDSVCRRAPLPSTAGAIDPRDYRTFVEALRFVSAQP